MPIPMDSWRTAVAHSNETGLWLRGYDVGALMLRPFTDTVFLLHRGRLPNLGERQLLDAVLVGVSDPGPAAPSCAAARLAASGNRQSVSAAIAAGILAIGDEHGGAGEGCMVLIREGVEEARRDGIAIDEAAARAVSRAVQSRRRLPGLGHRVHTTDPRVQVLFDLAARHGVAGDGVAFVRALEQAAAERIKALPINIDGALAAVLHDFGFDPPAGKLIFIVGRTAGITAEVAEEYAREKPMRVRIPVQYDGEPPRSVE
jgi:citrate synthase